MKKIDKVTFDAIADEMEVDLSAEVVFEGKNAKAKIELKRLLGHEEAVAFVDDIATQCIDIRACKYRPELFDFSVKANTLVYYAGFAKPGNMENAYSVIYGTNLYDVIRGEIDEEQYMALVSAAKERVNNDKEIMNRMLVTSMNAEIERENDK